MIISVLLITVGCSGLAYLWGCYIGLTQGLRLGRERADAEWAKWAEHGAMPTLDVS